MANWTYYEVLTRIHKYQKLTNQYDLGYKDAKYGLAFGHSNNHANNELYRKAYEIGWHYGRYYKHGIDIPDYILAKDDAGILAH